MDPSQLSEHFFDFAWFAERFFSIRDRHGRVVPFRMNELQLELLPTLVGRDDVLKARKGGVSTLVDLMMLHRALVRPNYHGLILAHEHKSAIDVFDIIRVAYDHLPDLLKPKLAVDARQEIMFEGTKSQLRAHTAKNPNLGRGGTIDALHCSEVAYWDTPAATLAAVGASLGADATIVRESTANGAGTYWHKEWIKGKNRKSGYKVHFFNWTVERSYRVEASDPAFDHDEFDESGTRLPFVHSDRERELGLDETQARWRRRRVREFGDKFAQEYAEDDVTCFLVSGHSVFDGRMLQLEYARMVERSVDVSINPSLGLTEFLRYGKDKLRRTFVIGADAAEGIADPTDPGYTGDYCAAYVLDQWSGEQVAAVHGSWEPHEYARILAQVGRRYTTASGAPLIGVERQGGGTAVLSELRNHHHYPNLYWHEDFDEVRRKAVRRLGWHTNAATRPILIDGLVKAVTKGHMKVNDPEFLAECMTFVRGRHGRAAAQSGCFDDRVMAAAIAWQMRARTSGIPLVGSNFS